MGGTRDVYRRREKCMQNFGFETEERRQFWRRMRTLEGNIKMYLKKKESALEWTGINHRIV